jgi:class 3 adenylate cyclase
MSERILVVDDTPLNVKLLADLLGTRGYVITTASSGGEALAKVAIEAPDLVLLDIMMPGMSGYEVCRRLRADAATALLPVVLVTSLDPQEERVRGIEAGADDFLSKPINQPELFARVKSLLRIKRLHDERLERLKGFFSAELAEAIVSGSADELLKPHRREIAVVFLDIRGFTAFTEAAEPEEVMQFLGQFHELVGAAVIEHKGTIERFAGDGMMIFFNDPLVLPNAAEQAVRMALAVHRRYDGLRQTWRKLGYELELGAGIALGYATLGMIGFEGRRDYAAIGSVTNLAARLCAEARAGQTLTNQKTLARIEHLVHAEPVGALSFKGFTTPTNAFNIVRIAAA